MSVFLKFSGKSYALPNDESLEAQIVSLFSNLSIDSSSLTYESNAKPLFSFNRIQNNSTIRATIPLVGGKGGYGAKLKNQGGKKVRPNDNRFSRDAQGRRIEYQMAEKEYTQFIKKKMQEDEKVNHERQQFRVMQETMKEGHSFMKLDKKYNQEVEEAEKKLTQSIRIGREKLLENKIKMNNYFKENYQSEEKKQKRSEDNYQQEILGSQEQKKEKQEEKEERQEQKKEKEEEKEEKSIDELEKPIKKVKIDRTVIEQMKTEKPVLTSAKDKLKSLFKR